MFHCLPAGGHSQRRLPRGGITTTPAHALDTVIDLRASNDRSTRGSVGMAEIAG
jgi:hypothetical protein